MQQKTQETKKQEQHNKKIIIVEHKQKLCHKNPTVLFDQLYLGSWHIVDGDIDDVDVLVPLAGSAIDHTVWRNWFGLISYVPIKDQGVLPRQVLKKKVDEVLRYLNAGLKVGICCMGGHGRTGYFASCVLGKWKPEIENPVDYLRENYCSEVVESEDQLNEIAEFLGNPEILKSGVRDYLKGYSAKLDNYGYYYYDDDYDYHDSYYAHKRNDSVTNVKNFCTICSQPIYDDHTLCPWCRNNAVKCKICGKDTLARDGICYACKESFPCKKCGALIFWHPESNEERLCYKCKRGEQK